MNFKTFIYSAIGILLIGYLSNLFIWGQTSQSGASPLAHLCLASGQCIDYFQDKNGYAYESIYTNNNGQKTPAPRDESNDATAALIPAVSQKGDTIQLSDGSSWSIDPTFQSIVSQWGSSDQVTIQKPGRDFGINFYMAYARPEYNLVSLKGKQGIKAKLQTGSESLSHQINSIDTKASKICLSDSTCWPFDPKLSTTIETLFKVGDDVLIGVNTDLSSNNYPFFLANPANGATVDVKAPS